MDNRKADTSNRKPHHNCKEWHDLNLQVLDLKDKIFRLEKKKLEIEIREERATHSK